MDKCFTLENIFNQKINKKIELTFGSYEKLQLWDGGGGLKLLAACGSSKE